MSIKGICLVFTLLFFFIDFIQAESDSIQTNSLKENNSYSAHDARAGERVFNGLITGEGKTVNCASCHNVNQIDTFNWSPSAMDLALKFDNKDFATFKNVITQPTGKVMASIHDSINLSDEELHQIKAYFIMLSKQGLEPAKPLITNRLIFSLLILLFILAFIDLTVTHKVRIRVLHILVLVITLVFMTDYIVRAAIDIGRSPNYQPDQPIKFSHKVHAGQNQTSCLYCHFNAERSKFAGIPPVSVCMNCHILVREGSRSGKFEIAKIYQAMGSNKPVRWVKVHNLPDFVYFNHSQHVVAGKIDCAKCHGDVASMDQIIQVKDLSMGWCVNCHRQTAVQFDNRFYGKYEQLHKDLREGKLKAVTVEKIGGTDCMKCHY
jgi:cytochrome c553